MVNKIKLTNFKKHIPGVHRCILISTGNVHGLKYFGKDINGKYVALTTHDNILRIRVGRLFSFLPWEPSIMYSNVNEMDNDSWENLASDISKCMKHGRYWELDLSVYGLEYIED